MAAPKKYTFHYHANAHALSARIDRPVKHVIGVQAGTSLPTTGGHGHVRVEEFRFNEFVSFKSAYSHVSGSEQKENGKLYHTTLVTTAVEGLNLFDVLTVDKVVAQLSSSYEFGDKEPRIVNLGSRFDNLRIAGCPAEVEFNHDLGFKLDTFEAIRKEVASNKNFWKMTEEPLQPGIRQKQPQSDKVFLCTLVKEIRTPCPGVKHVGIHGLSVPAFGTVYFAEILVAPGKRTLTMIRFELGSPIGGDGTVAQVVANGHHWP